MDKLELINAVIESFEQKERGDGITFYCLKYGTNEDIKDLLYRIHDGMMPNDWIYEKTLDLTYSIKECLEDDQEPEELQIDDHIDIYTSDLLAWVSSNIDFLYDCDQAIQELGSEGMIGILQGGQYLVLDIIKYRLIGWLEDNAQDEDL